MSANSRAKQVLFNSFFGICGSLVSLVSAYAIRVEISKVLGDEIYGLNSAIYSIINALLILELGISAAIVIFLYKPVAENNTEEIKSIVAFYRNVYRVFCLILFVIGLLLCLFGLPFFINTTIPLNSVRICFALYLLGIIFRYLFGYKKSLLFASQKNRVNALITAIVELVFCVIEIILILKTQNYYVYLALFILQNLCTNAVCNIYVNAHYPFIKERRVKKIGSDFKQRILTVIKPMFVQRISNQVNNTSSSIILGILSDVISVGHYSNYLIIVHAAQTVMTQISNSFTSSFGNLAATESGTDRQYDVYQTTRMGIHCISVIMIVGFYTLTKTAIILLFGLNYVLPGTTYILITAYLYLTLVCTVDMSVQNAIGLHCLDSKMMIVQTAVTICLSLLFGYFLGLNGVILGNIIPFLTFSILNKTYMIHTRYFALSLRDFAEDIIVELAVAVLIAAAVVFTTNMIGRLQTSLVLHALLCLSAALVETVTLLQIIYRKNTSFISFRNRILKTVFK